MPILYIYSQSVVIINVYLTVIAASLLRMRVLYGWLDWTDVWMIDGGNFTIYALFNSV